MDEIINQAKEYFFTSLANKNHDPYRIGQHVHEFEKWVQKILVMFPEANKNVVMLSVYLHDIGHVLGEKGVDHAIESERLAKIFLEDHKVDEEITKRVLHCVRAHRCKDVQPESIEAKIIAATDSASHMTDDPYFCMAKEGRLQLAIEKLERDFRDTKLLPGIHEMIIGFHDAWKKWLEEYQKFTE